jgi:uncharacterized membrane protein YcgQ (UPF0703/DUF1980 family)
MVRTPNIVEYAVQYFVNLFMHVLVMYWMVLVLIAIVVGVLVAVILIIKATKTPARDIVGMDITCKKCGTRTNGLACPKCKNKSQSFGV